MRKKILLSIFSGFIILIITWIYQSYNFSFFVEDSFFRKVSFWKYQIFHAQADKKVNFVFINTGKDVVVVNDTTEWGSVAVSDREKIYQLIHFINCIKKKPRFTVLDIQFQYPYNIKPSIDTLLQKEINNNHQILIPILKGADGKFKKPLYNALYGYSGYETFGFGFNKFKIWTHNNIHTAPVILDEKLNNAVYKDHLFYTTCNGHLCFTALWPSFYLLDKDVKENAVPISESYNLGEILLGIAASPDEYAKIFDNKILIVGNFAEDVHLTPVGSMSGSVVLANIYLTLLNKQHLVSYLFLFILWLAFSALSYLAWFSRMPEIKFKFRFIFSPDVIKFITGYLSYFGSMFFLSLLAILLFNMNVALFLPAFIFAGIEYVRHKKYLPPPL